MRRPHARSCRALGFSRWHHATRPNAREPSVLVPRCETLASHVNFLAATPTLIVAIYGIGNPRVEAGPATNEVFALRFIARDECIVALAAIEFIGGLVRPQPAVDESIV